LDLLKEKSGKIIDKNTKKKHIYIYICIPYIDSPVLVDFALGKIAVCLQNISAEEVPKLDPARPGQRTVSCQGGSENNTNFGTT